MWLLQIRSTFTTDDQSHYLFTPRDLTQWVINLLRYKYSSEASSSSTEEVLEVWSYEAKRLFCDRLVGEKAQKTFDSLLSSVLMSEWSIDLSQHENEAAVYYVTWAATPTISTADQAQKYGRSLGRLAAPDLKEVVAKGILSYSKNHETYTRLNFMILYGNSFYDFHMKIFYLKPTNINDVLNLVTFIVLGLYMEHT